MKGSYISTRLSNRMKSSVEGDLNELELGVSSPCECCARCGVQAVDINYHQATYQDKPVVLDQPFQGTDGIPKIEGLSLTIGWWATASHRVRLDKLAQSYSSVSSPSNVEHTVCNQPTRSRSPWEIPRIFNCRLIFQGRRLCMRTSIRCGNIMNIGAATSLRENWLVMS